MLWAYCVLQILFSKINVYAFDLEVLLRNISLRGKNDSFSGKMQPEAQNNGIPK